MSFLDTLEENPKLLEAMAKMPERANNKMIDERREEMFKMLWEHTNLEKSFVITEIKQMENDYIRVNNYEDEPDWLVRGAAQDAIVTFIEDKFQEEGLI